MSIKKLGDFQVGLQTWNKLYYYDQVWDVNSYISGKVLGMKDKSLRQMLEYIECVQSELYK